MNVLTFPPLADLTPVKARNELAKCGYFLRNMEGDQALLGFVDLTKRYARLQHHGLLTDEEDIPGRLWAAAETAGLVATHGPDTIENLMAKAIEAAQSSPNDDSTKSQGALQTITPAAWKGTEPIKQRWLAYGRIPSGDLTLYSGNGGAGKTETAVQLLVSVAAGLGDWLGCVVESGPVFFLSCEEPEANIRDRVERICKQRGIDPNAIDNLHQHYPDLEETWLVTVDRAGRVLKTPLFDKVEKWIAANKPRLVVIDSIAAVFDGEAIARRQVRAFLAMLRKVAREHDTAIVLLDHPSVRGMSDGSGTANSVDWRNSVRSMLHLSDPEKEDQDLRVLEVKKSNYGRFGEKVTLRWDGLTFVPEGMGGAPSHHKAAAERDVDELFLRLLDKRNAQGRTVHASNAKGNAPTEFAIDPEANGTTADAFRRAMSRLFDAGKIKKVETGPASRRREHIERVTQ
ncbi:AAA family ATPase [Bradyrhizobium sp. USDA 4502]